MTDAAPPLASGRYRLIRILGEGAQATVYRAWDSRLRVWRAIKVLHPHSRRPLRERFETEARLLARLKHPNLLAIHDVGEEPGDNGRAYMVMDLAADNLEQRMLREGPLPADLAVRLFVKIADALSAAHRDGIVHRDIKPSNILADASGEPLVADFGIARVSGERRTKTGGVLGTLMFMAPEQRVDSTTVDARADIYSLGAALYAVLTGHEPTGPLEDLSDLALSAIPAPLLPVLRKATARDPLSRHPTADALRADLAAILPAMPATRSDWRPPITPAEPPPETDTSRGHTAQTAIPTYTTAETLTDAPQTINTILLPPDTDRKLLTGARIGALIALMGIAGVGLAAGAVAAIALLWMQGREPQESPAAEPVPVAFRRLTTYPPEISLSLGGLSEDGASLTYAQGGVGIWRQPVSGTEPPTLLERDPAADGEVMSFRYRLIDAGGKGAIFDLESRTTIPFEHDATQIAFSADGTQIAWVTSKGALYREEIGTNRAVALYQTPEGRHIEGMTWSPGADQLAISVFEPPLSHHILAIDDRGTSSRLLYRSPHVDNQLGSVGLVWPWEGAILVPEADGDEDHIVLVPTDGGEPRRFATFPGRIFSAVVRGRTLALLGFQPLADSWIASVGARGALTDLHPAWANEDADYPIGWLPDGALAYVSDRYRKSQILAQRLDDPVARTLADCDWAKIAGSEIVVFDGREALVRWPVPGEGQPPISCSQGGLGLVSCSGDGTCVAAENLGDRIAFKRFAPGQTEPEPLPPFPEVVDLQFALSPTAIAAVPTSGSGLWVRELTDERWRQIPLEGIVPQRVAWRTDAKGLWVTGMSETGWLVVALDGDGAVETINSIDAGWPSQPVPSPDGRSLAFFLQRFDGDIWVTSLPQEP